jgi:hypothetical protein
MADFKTILVKDSAIGDITSDIDFAVMSGASQTTFQPFPSTSSSNSAVIFNIQVPSENVVVGRDILISTALQANMRFTNDGTVGNGVVVAQYGVNFSLQAFPFNSLLTTATCQINNTTVSINTQDVLPSLLRMNNSRELYRYNSTTPSLPDQSYYTYADAALTNNNPIASYGTASYDLDQVPRGAFPALVTVGRYLVNNVYQDDSPVSTGTAGEYWLVNFQTVVTEPLFLSPWIWGNPEFNAQGLLGINNMAFTLTIDSTCKRLFSVLTVPGITMTSSSQSVANASLGVVSIDGGAIQVANSNGFQFSPPVGTSSIGIFTPPTNPSMLFKFLSTQPSDLIQTKNIVPYHDFPRYLSSSANSTTLAAGANVRLSSNNLQINQIPDLFIITIRKAMSSQTNQDSMAQLTINNISLNLNNQSGLLSSASQYDLWRMSERNGSTQSFNEFCGQQFLFSNGIGGLVPTTGAVLVINPAYDLSLPDYITCGSLGNYNFQFQVSVTNQSTSSISNVEICVVCVNSGIFSTQQGVSAVYTGILTKEMVLGAKSHQQASAMTSMEVARMIGGKKLTPLTAYKGIAKRMGMGMSGAVSSGGMSGAVSSGGRHAKKYC